MINPHWLIFCFFVYAFGGWMVELVFRSVTNRRLVNPGLLFGPFLPIYGVGAIIILVPHVYLHDTPMALQAPLYLVIATFVEFSGGVILERAFHLTLWDYTMERFNFHGRICLKYSLLWTLMAVVTLTLIHPLVVWVYGSLLGPTRAILLSGLGVYLMVDVIISVASVQRFREQVAYLATQYLTLDRAERQGLYRSLDRFMHSFPSLQRMVDQHLGQAIGESLTRRMSEVKEELRQRYRLRKPVEREFNSLVRDILDHPEFQRLKEFPHHNATIYEHVVAVSYLTYKTCKYLNLDYRSAARGALLHDFFLYNWRDEEGRPYGPGKFHGMEHPKVALANAHKHFDVNELEHDIIIKHMWPLTMQPPQHRESFVVSFLDKYVASREFMRMVRLPKTKRPKRRKRQPA